MSATDYYDISVFLKLQYGNYYDNQTFLTINLHGKIIIYLRSAKLV